MMTDPIADMLTRIRNAAMARHERTRIPYSNIKLAIARILTDEGYINGFEKDDEGHGSIVVTLKYDRNRRSAIAGIQRCSKPGLRVYVGHSDIPKVRNGLGIGILSTSQGLMTDRAARDARVGGEIVCEVW